MKIWIDNGSFGTHSGSFHINNHKNTETSTTVNGWHFTAMPYYRYVDATMDGMQTVKVHFKSCLWRSNC